jgi:Cu(I)/Ag(I) efflux system membrane fusion protein
MASKINGIFPNTVNLNNSEMKNIFSSKTLIYSLFLAGGLFLGWLIFHSPEINPGKQEQAQASTVETIWTCSMHPQIRKTEAGMCPICGMELISLNQTSSPVDSDAISFTKEAIALANVQTSIVSREEPVMDIRLYGKIQADERLLQSQVAHISGRIEKLLVNFTGEAVSKGQVLALVYSPELITAQQELLESATTKQSQPEIYEAAKERLRQWKLTESQISNIESTGKIQNTFELVSNTSGIVISRKINNGDYISRGSVLYEIADLSKVWVLFDAYESELGFLNKGDKLSFTVQSLPGKSFTGSIVFIDQVIDPLTRVAKVRAEINNQAGLLKPEMFATGNVSAKLEEYRDNFIIPRSAVLWTGKRSIVYVKLEDSEEPVFKIREVELGPILGNSYVVVSGLSEGEEIVTQGSFSVDAAAQLQGKSSMMNSDEGQQASSETLTQVSISVLGKCGMCKDRIETAAKSVSGVSLAIWDSKTNMLSLEFDSRAKIDEIHRVIAKAGHDTDKMKTEDSVYNSLPECCLYRE